MAAKTQQQTPAQTTAQQGGASGQAQTTGGTGRGNRAAADKLLKGGGGGKPNVNLTGASDANGFMRGVSAAMDAAVPNRGSFASLAVAGSIPLYTNGAASVRFEPSLGMQISREMSGEFAVTIDAKAQIKAEAGTNGWGWIPALKGHIAGHLRGALKIVGDSSTEIMREFMLLMRTVMEAACDAAGAPRDVKSIMCNAIMGDSTKAATVKGMDSGDSVTSTFGIGGEIGGSIGNNSAAAGYEYTNTTSITNKDSNPNAAEVTSSGQHAVTIQGTFESKKLGVKTNPKVVFILANGGLKEFFVGLSVDKEMKLSEFGPLVLMGTEWATDFGMAIKGLVRDAARRSNRSEVARISSLVGGLSFGPEALKYTAFGDQLKQWSRSPEFAGKSSQSITFGVAAQAGWSKAKGANAQGALKTSRSFKLGGAGSPLSIEAKSGDTIAELKAAAR